MHMPEVKDSFRKRSRRVSRRRWRLSLLSGRMKRWALSDIPRRQEPVHDSPDNATAVASECVPLGLQCGLPEPYWSPRLEEHAVIVDAQLYWRLAVQRSCLGALYDGIGRRSSREIGDNSMGWVFSRPSAGEKMDRGA